MFIDTRPLFVGRVGERSPVVDGRICPAALGVVKGDPWRREGDEREPEIGGLTRASTRSALFCCVGLSVGGFRSRVLSC